MHLWRLLFIFISPLGDSRQQRKNYDYIQCERDGNFSPIQCKSDHCVCVNTTTGVPLSGGITFREGTRNETYCKKCKWLSNTQH